MPGKRVFIRMWKGRFSTLLMALMLIPPVVGAAAEAGRVSEVHGLGPADPQAAYELVQGVLSPGGRAVLDEGHNSLIVLDTPDRQEAVRKTLATLRGQGPLLNVRVETRMVDRGANGHLTRMD